MKKMTKRAFWAIAIAMVYLMAISANAAPKYSSGSSKPSSSKPTPPPSRPPPAKPSPAPSRPTPSPTPAPKPVAVPSSAKPKIDSAAAKDAKVEYSRTVRTKPATEYKPEPAYKTASGASKPINASDPGVQRLRSNYNYDTYSTRSTRYTTAFGPSYSSYGGYTTTVYSDPINPFFYGWMMSSALNSSQRAEWVYHHRSEIDDARYREMLAKDALLDAKIREIEAKGIARNSGYVPNGVDPDLMYDDNYVRAATGVAQAEADVRAAEARLAAAQASSSWSFWGVMKVLFKIALWIVVAIIAIWFIVAVVTYMRQ